MAINQQDKKRDEFIKNRGVVQNLSFEEGRNIYKWSMNPSYMSFDKESVDTSLWMNHLLYPQQRKLEYYTFLGNIGSPTNYDHFFSNDHFTPFLFNRFHRVYTIEGFTQPYYNVRKPFTVLTYSTAGKRRVAEQILRVLHTQNINPYINFGITYDYFGTKGIYSHQETRNNSYSLFASYNKGNISSYFNFSNNVFYNQENGGLVDDYFVQDTVVEQPRVIPFWLNDDTKAQSTLRGRHLSGMVGYTILNQKSTKIDQRGKSSTTYLPLLNIKATLNGVRNTRTYLDVKPSIDFYKNIFINPGYTNDSVYHSTWDTKVLIELEQHKQLPFLPGIRLWYGNQQVSYYYYQPGDYIFNRANDELQTNHIGIAATASMQRLSYRGSARVFIDGYKADDKEFDGEINFTPWDVDGMPSLNGTIKFVERTPEVFYQNYFSNHYKWSNEFEKENWVMIAANAKSKEWKYDLGYNLMLVNNFIYFDTTSVPAQIPDLRVMSVYVEKGISFKGFSFFNRIIWQNASNSDVIAIPQIMLFSTLYYENYFVKNVLRAQIGVSGFYRTRFYADAYSPAIGQYYNQREKLLGGYPTLDVYANFKWKRALLFFKYEHVNQGFPTLEYFSALHYPINRRIFKFGVSWMFYD